VREKMILETKNGIVKVYAETFEEGARTQVLEMLIPNDLAVQGISLIDGKLTFTLDAAVKE
jgi:hypothetical protein